MKVLFPFYVLGEEMKEIRRIKSVHFDKVYIVILAYVQGLINKYLLSK